MRITIQLDDVTQLEHMVTSNPAESDIAVMDAGPARIQESSAVEALSGATDLDAGSAPETKE